MTIYKTIKELLISVEPDSENDFELLDAIFKLVDYVIGLF